MSGVDIYGGYISGTWKRDLESRTRIAGTPEGVLATGDVEDAVGRARYFFFYLACGIAAALAQAFVDPASSVPMVGASGAIGGVLGRVVELSPMRPHGRWARRS